MKVLMRETLAGNEYWDTKAKKTLFVPAGKEPSFEVTDNPTSMIGEPDPDPEVESITMFPEMTIKQLRDYAKKHEIQIPSETTKQADIAAFLNEATLNEGNEAEEE